MPDKKFTYLILITITLLFLALISFLIQPRYETFLKKGELVFEDTKKQLNNIKEINIDNGKKKYRFLKIKTAIGICHQNQAIKLRMRQ